MTTCDDTEFWKARLAKVDELIVKYEDAMLQVGTGAVQSYSLDTGQTRQTVTKQNLATIRDTYKELLDLRDILHLRVHGGGAAIGVPGWP